ncbi:DUF2550 family protein [Modestobacter sp. I12A-02628]|uniref:DUF2550 family protein n=1 Tax=Goekera deserti TaxID=2497753 RepID=A0A7K3W7H9_9ACTN|nr:DUF2550 domain-containing protein [Goekera deserti]MPQ99942.1 DUF2550 family protein [Goekera deserti]NDI50101.1 DUF2550 family protein [Goekera deserti]NEL52422.1 DUF2550 family protein [Goekera deserti]
MTTLVLVAGGVLLVAVVVAFLLRRRFLLSGLGAVTMWLRPGGAPRWAVGVAWFSGDSLNWYRAVSLSVRPQRRLCRAELVVQESRRATHEDLALPVDTVVLTCRTASGAQELAMDASTVTGFLSWVESAPPATR